MPEAEPIERLRIVTPVFNDWASFDMLMRDLDREAAQMNCQVHVTAVNDGSTQQPSDLHALASSLSSIASIEVVHLATNVGHQRAIAIGLCLAADDADSDAVLIMDSDGEDPPACIPTLLSAARGKSDFCVVAARQKRSERLMFRTGYFFYKRLFKAVTGSVINFGNFSLHSIGNVRRLTMLPDLWNNLAAAVLRSRMKIDKIFMDRGKRYAGKSQMNFNSLIVHGFSTISVYSDTIFVRLLLATIGMMGFTAVGIVFVLVLRIFFPAHATPGWATTVSVGMVIILLQVLFATFTSLLMLLNNRTQRLIIPAVDYSPYVRERQRIK